jgi:hypothetical protein
MVIVVVIVALFWGVIAAVSLCPFRCSGYSDDGERG